MAGSSLLVWCVTLVALQSPTLVTSRCSGGRCSHDNGSIFSQCPLREGVCPVNDIITTCQVTANACTHDNQCPRGLKCCSRGCGRECVRPCASNCTEPSRCVQRPCRGDKCLSTCERTLREGVCPVNDIITTCQVTANACTHDNQCPRGLKCCSRGCGRECVRPCASNCTEPSRCVQRPCRGDKCLSTCERKCYYDEVPPSCAGVQCDEGGRPRICALQQVICVRAPCYPVPTCIDNPCASVRCAHGSVCQLVQPIVSSGRPEVSCVPLARPKPGFCPPKHQVSQANANLCQFDNDCASDLICCPGASRDGLNCTAPVHPSPCACDKCQDQEVGRTCAVRQGTAVCLDRVCEPLTHFCRDGKQSYCSREAEIVHTDLPCAK